MRQLQLSNGKLKVVNSGVDDPVNEGEGEPRCLPSVAATRIGSLHIKGRLT